MTFTKRVKDMGSIYFHGASNDKGQDPENKRIMKPTPEHPFFVSNIPEVAMGYSEIPTGPDGRIKDKYEMTGDFGNNARVYIVGLTEDLAQTKNYFSIFDEDKIEEVCAPYMSELGMKSFKSMAARSMSMFQFFNELSRFVEMNIHALKNLAMLPDDEIMDGLRKTTMFKMGLMRAPIAGELTPVFRNCYLKGKISRRDLRGAFFRMIYDECGYKAVADTDTNTDTDGMVEFGLLDMSLVKNAVAIPVRTYVVDDAIRLFNKNPMGFPGETPMHKFVSAIDAVMYGN